MNFWQNRVCLVLKFTKALKILHNRWSRWPWHFACLVLGPEQLLNVCSAFLCWEGDTLKCQQKMLQQQWKFVKLSSSFLDKQKHTLWLFYFCCIVSMVIEEAFCFKRRDLWLKIYWYYRNYLFIFWNELIWVFVVISFVHIDIYFLFIFLGMINVTIEYNNFTKKLDGVDSVDNRPSTNKLHHFVPPPKKKKCHLTPDTWHKTHDTWHMTHDMWHTVGSEHCFKIWVL